MLYCAQVMMSEETAVSEVMPWEEKFVEETIVYPGVMKGAAVPQTAAAKIDCPSGEVLERVLPLTETVYTDARWEDLSLELVFHEYGADGYLFAGRMVGHDAEKPPVDLLEEEIAEELGVSPEEIVISDGVWLGEAYADDSGELCRDALALGQRLVYDCSASYGAMIKIPPDTELSEETASPESEVIPETVLSPETDAAPDYGPPAQVRPGLLQRAVRWMTEHIKVTVSLFLLALLAAGFLLLRRLARREDGRRNTC